MLNLSNSINLHVTYCLRIGGRVAPLADYAVVWFCRHAVQRAVIAALDGQQLTTDARAARSLTQRMAGSAPEGQAGFDAPHARELVAKVLVQVRSLSCIVVLNYVWCQVMCLLLAVSKFCGWVYGDKSATICDRPVCRICQPAGSDQRQCAQDM
jgi:hypothetical protein